MSDRRVFLAVVVLLGVTLLACVAGIIGLAVNGTDIPGILENVTVGALTGLAGILARGPQDSPQEVTAPPGRPLQVTEEP